MKAPPVALTPCLSGAERVHVGFTDAGRGGVLRCLKPGFRHCLAIVEGRGWWLTVDPLASHLYVAVTRPDPSGAPRHRLLASGFTVASLTAPQASAGRGGPLGAADLRRGHQAPGGPACAVRADALGTVQPPRPDRGGDGPARRPPRSHPGGLR